MLFFKSALFAVAMFVSQIATATIYTFHSTEVSALSATPATFDFNLDTASAVADANALFGSPTTFGGVTINTNGAPVLGNTVKTSFGTQLSSPLFSFISTDSGPFYTGSGTDINFNTGNFTIASQFTNGIGTLTISEVAASAVPEPATWLLMFGGIGMVGTALRVRRRNHLLAIA